jgi:nucleotide-binding universal stress UspA family protein
MPVPYKRVLLPLDGSPVAEVAIADAAAVAERFGAELTLLQAIAPIRDVLPLDGVTIAIDEQFDVRRADALGYLGRIRRARVGAGVKVGFVVEMGAPADVILGHAGADEVDLIVMATHGRSGIKRLVLGSVADKVLRTASSAVLLVRAG